MSDSSQPNSATNLFVVPDEVGQVGQYLTELAQVFKSSIESVVREIDELGKTWTGTAANNFAKRWTDIYDQSPQLLTSLTDLANSLNVVAKNYKLQDDTNANYISSLNLD
ncbi:WXG100 family type VII secretion target [Nocardia salmonicida]|uniref:WXG100 family type VII secretion target n=1 Tax=Nocardia salmonicida TaxID=53431 RepID=UPI0033E2AD6F